MLMKNVTDHQDCRYLDLSEFGDSHEGRRFHFHAKKPLGSIGAKLVRRFAIRRIGGPNTPAPIRNSMQMENLRDSVCQ